MESSGKRKSQIFVINLDRSVVRWQKMREQLENLGLSYERFSAIDGNAQSGDFLGRYYSAELNKKKYYVPLSKGEMGCYISHLKVCEKIVSEGLDYAIVLEDDIVLKEAFKCVLPALDALKGWNYIKLIAPFGEKHIVSRKPVIFEIPARCDCENWTLNKDTNLCEITKSSRRMSVPVVFELVGWDKPPAGTQAYAITKEGAKEFLAKRSVFYRPIDVDLQFTWETSLNVMGLSPFCCEITDVAPEISRKKCKHYLFARLVYKLKYVVASRLYKFRK